MNSMPAHYHFETDLGSSDDDLHPSFECHCGAPDKSISSRILIVVSHILYLFDRKWKGLFSMTLVSKICAESQNIYLNVKRLDFNRNYFQVFARFMLMLNILIPSIAVTFIISMRPTELHICLGEGYLNYLPSQFKFCPYENWFSYIFCWTLLILVSIFMSNIIDAYCIFWCVQEINASTEESKDMVSNQAYNNRKR